MVICPGSLVTPNSFFGIGESKMETLGEMSTPLVAVAVLLTVIVRDVVCVRMTDVVCAAIVSVSQQGYPVHYDAMPI